MNNILMLLLLTGGLGNLFGGSSTGSSMGSLLPLMLLSGGKINTLMTMGLATNNPTLTTMGAVQGAGKKTYRRRYTRRRYNSGTSALNWFAKGMAAASHRGY